MKSKKKGYGHIREKISDNELTHLIQEESTQHPIMFMCEVLDIPRSTYYQSLHKVESEREKENNQLTVNVS